MKKWINKLLSDAKEPSSKRFAGVLGWMLFLALSAYALITQKADTSILDTLAVVSAGLLGLDTITGIFKKKE